jgi:hypothetical protein
MDVAERLASRERCAFDTVGIGDFSAASNARRSTSANITFIPASAKARPSASPMPEAPPVTNAVLPFNSRTRFPTRRSGFYKTPSRHLA